MKIIKKYGGGGSSTTTNTVPDYLQPYLTAGLDRSKSALESGQLDTVAGFNANQLAAQNAATQGPDSVVAQQNAAAANAQNATSTLNLARSTGFGVDPSVLANNPQLQAVQNATIAKAQQAMQPGLASASAAGVGTGDRAAVVSSQNAAALAAQLASNNLNQLNTASTNATNAANSTINATPTLQTAAATGTGTQQSVGTAQQQQTQAEDNAIYQGLSRYSSIIQGTPWQSKQTTTGGK